MVRTAGSEGPCVRFLVASIFFGGTGPQARWRVFPPGPHRGKAAGANAGPRRPGAPARLRGEDDLFTCSDTNCCEPRNASAYCHHHVHKVSPLALVGFKSASWKPAASAARCAMSISPASARSRRRCPSPTGLPSGSGCTNASPSCRTGSIRRRRARFAATLTPRFQWSRRRGTRPRPAGEPAVPAPRSMPWPRRAA